MKQRATRMDPREVVVSTTCDGCGKRVNSDTPGDWLTFSSSHNDWGNDSIESCEQHDACSAACFLRIARRIVDEYGDEPCATLEVAGFSLPLLRGLLDLTDDEGSGG
jgi:hypothetical protein